jgi:hypothetical protein
MRTRADRNPDVPLGFQIVGSPALYLGGRVPIQCIFLFALLYEKWQFTVRSVDEGFP